MAQCEFTEMQKSMLRSIVPGLKDGSVSAEWHTQNGDNRIVAIFGLDRAGNLRRGLWKDVKYSDFDDFVECGIFKEIKRDQRGAIYSLHKQRIITLVEANFNDQDASILSPEYKSSLSQFRQDYPTSTKTAFIMMSFADTAAHREISRAVKQTLASQNIVGLRADDKEYHPDLYGNIVTYMHGCSFGIGVFDNLTNIPTNPNVALEVGFMLALNKRVCLLKDMTLPNLQVDLVGKLYRAFDPQQITSTLEPTLLDWLTKNI